jgi:hypothetical protein
LPGCVKAKANVDTDIKTDINTELQARIDPKLDAVIAGQAGVNNKLETISNEVRQELRAGRDVNNTNVQFNHEMLEALKSANAVAVESIRNFAYVLVSLFGAITTILTTVFYRGKKKAERMFEDSNRELKSKQMQLERAIGALPPETADRLFPKE